MLKKTFLTFVALTVFTTFYGFNVRRELPTLRPEGELPRLLREGEYIISAYDDIVRYVSHREGRDWRFVSAIIYQESRFRPDIVSRRGACGLMQVMPAVALQFDVPAENIADPQTNVWLGNKILEKIADDLDLPAEISEQDYLSLVLASYNGGIGHVSDARRLARHYGENPNSWEVVSRYLALKNDPEYYNNRVVKCGRFSGSRETQTFVQEVMRRYKIYCRMAEL